MQVDRVVLDTNVLISAVLSPLGKPASCFDWVVRNATLLVSESLVDELQSRLRRPRIARRVTPERVSFVLSELARLAVFVEPTERIKACRDPDDEKLLEIAVFGDAGWIVTGDEDLLVLNPFQGVRIVTPSDFLDLNSVPHVRR